MKQYELSPKLKIKPSNFISRRDEEHRYITENPELILVYPPQREHQVVMFWNENLDDYNQLIEDFSELLNIPEYLVLLVGIVIFAVFYYLFMYRNRIYYRE